MKHDLPLFAVIVAGGTGKRMQTDVPKQFLPLGHYPMIVHTVKRFAQTLPAINIIIVVHPDWQSHLRQIIEVHLRGLNIQLVPGGKTRFHSVKNGLSAIEESVGKVAVHDAVRPFISPAVIKRAMELARPGTGIVPAVVPKDSLRKIEAAANRAVDRNAYRLVQTPQCFVLDDLREAYDAPYEHAYTDDASVFENSGKKIELIDGNEENIKITGPLDMKLAELVLKHDLA